MRFPQLSQRLVRKTWFAAVALAVAAATALVVLPTLRALATEYIATQNAPRSYFEFRNSTTSGWNPLLTPWHYASTSANPSPSKSNVAYCLEHRKDYPLGNENYSAFNPATLYNSRTRDGLQVIMEKGYPASTGWVWGTHLITLTDNEARYATANAIRAWIYERGGGGYAFMDFSNYDPSNSSTWKLVRPQSSDNDDVMVYTLLLLQAARADDALRPSVKVSMNDMQLVGGSYVGHATVLLNDCNAGYKIQSQSPWLTISGFTGKSGNVLTLSAPRAHAGQKPSLMLVGRDNRTSADVFWYAASASNLQHFVVSDMSVKNDAAQTSLNYTMPTGSLRIRKIDKADGTPLAGATFRIYQGTAGGGTVLIDSPVSGADGYATSVLPPGVYNVYEVVPPSGYKVDPLPQTVTVTDGTTTDITMSDQRANGRVFVHKVSALDPADSIVPTAPVEDPPPPPIGVCSVPRSPGAELRSLSPGAVVGLPPARTVQDTTSTVAVSGVATETDLPGAVFTLSQDEPVTLDATLSPYMLVAQGPGSPAGVLTSELHSPVPGDQVGVAWTLSNGGAVRWDGSSLIGLEPGNGEICLQTSVSQLSTYLSFNVDPYPIVADSTPARLQSGPDVGSASVMSTSTVFSAHGQDPYYVTTPPYVIPTSGDLYLRASGEPVSVEATWTDPSLTFGAWSTGATTTACDVTAADLPLSFSLVSSSTDASGVVTGSTSTLGVPATTVLPLPNWGPESVHTLLGTYREVVETMTTGPDGTVMSEEHAPGTYYLQEVAAPPGYELDATLHKFTLSAGDTADFKIADIPRRGDLAVVKSDAVTGNLLAGAQFEVDAEDGSFVAAMTTDENGSAIATGLAPGDYTVSETQAPVGWQLNDKVSIFTVDPLSESPTITVDYTDAPLDRVGIEKRDLLGGHELLSGAVYELHSATDDSVVCTLTSGSDGRAESDLLPLGDYYAVETSAPAGFELDPSRQYVTLAGGGGTEVTMNLTDRPVSPEWGGVVVFFRHVWDDTEIAPQSGFDAPVGTDFVPWIRSSGFEGRKIAGFAYVGREDFPIPGPDACGYDPEPAPRVYTNAPGNGLDANGQPVQIQTKPGVVYGEPDPIESNVCDGTTYEPNGVLGTYTDVKYVGSTPATAGLIPGKLVLTYWYQRQITGEWKNVGVAPKTGDWRTGNIPSAELAKSGTLSREEMDKRLAAAMKKNPEVVGYLNVPGTGIHYPVVQGPDNTKYLTRDAAGAKSIRGAIFADVRCSPYVKGDTAARDTILYGHNMKDGTMFGRLDSYGSSSSFYKAHPLVQYVDAAGNGGLWRVYSVRQSSTADSVYTYPATTPYAKRVASWAAASAVNPGFKPKSDGWSLTLSTCTYDRPDGSGRILVQGELVEGYSNGVAGN